MAGSDPSFHSAGNSIILSAKLLNSYSLYPIQTTYLLKQFCTNLILLDKYEYNMYIWFCLSLEEGLVWICMVACLSAEIMNEVTNLPPALRESTGPGSRKQWCDNSSAIATLDILSDQRLYLRAVGKLVNALCLVQSKPWRTTI